MPEQNPKYLGMLYTGRAVTMIVDGEDRLLYVGAVDQDGKGNVQVTLYCTPEDADKAHWTRVRLNEKTRALRERYALGKKVAPDDSEGE